MPEHTVLCPSQGKAHTCAFVWESTYMHTGDSPPSQKKKQQLDHNIYGLPEHTLIISKPLASPATAIARAGSRVAHMSAPPGRLFGPVEGKRGGDEKEMHEMRGAHT